MSRAFDYAANTVVIDKFNLQLRGKITVVNGDSGTGKTAFVNLVKDYKTMGRALDEYQTDNIIVAANEAEGLGIQDRECLVIIDRADKALTQRWCDKINRDSLTHYLIFSREGHDLDISPNHAGEFVREDGKVKIHYDFDIKGWR